MHGLADAAAGRGKVAERLIIDNRTDISMSEALEYAIAVVKMGRISDGGESYCYATQFGRGPGVRVVVVANRNKRSDRLVLYMQERETDAHNEEDKKGN